MASFGCVENKGYIIDGILGIESDIDRAVKKFVEGAKASVELCRERGGSGPDNPNCAACSISKLTPNQLSQLVKNLKNGVMQIPSPGQ